MVRHGEFLVGAAALFLRITTETNPDGSACNAPLIITACMRKLLVILNAMLRDGTDWRLAA